jgi:hypothetical protein
MRQSTPQLCRLALCVAVALGAAHAQNQDVPNEPFVAVHLINLKSADAEKPLLAALADYNSAITKAGCPQCAYHLMKGISEKDGVHNYLWISHWPGREVYVKVHTSADYKAVDQKHPEMEGLIVKEIYDRYVELKAGK